MILKYVERIREKLIPLPTDFDQMIVESYLWGNQRFPQAAEGIAINFADFVLSQKHFDIMRFVNRKLTQDELRRLEDAMDKVHTAFGIPYTTQRGIESVREGVRDKRKIVGSNMIQLTVVDRERLNLLWLGFKSGALQIMAAAAGLNEMSLKWPMYDKTRVHTKDTGKDAFPDGRVEGFARMLKDREVFERVREIVHSFKETLASKEGLAMGRAIREVASRGVDKSNKKDVARRRDEVITLYDELIDLCVKNYITSRELSPEEIEHVIAAGRVIKRM